MRANVDCLSDFRVASLEDLEDALGLAAWPALPKKRFLDARRRLKDGEDEAAPRVNRSARGPRRCRRPSSRRRRAGRPRTKRTRRTTSAGELLRAKHSGGKTKKACEVRRVGDKEVAPLRLADRTPRPPFPIYGARQWLESSSRTTQEKDQRTELRRTSASDEARNVRRSG